MNNRQMRIGITAAIALATITATSIGFAAEKNAAPPDVKALAASQLGHWTLDKTEDATRATDGSKWVTGRFGKAADLDGKTAYLKLGNLGSWAETTIAFWIKPRNGGRDEFQGLVTTPSWDRNRLHLPIRAGRIDAYLHLGGKDRARLRSKGLVNDRWTHIAVTISSISLRAALYVDGVQVDTAATPGLEKIVLDNMTAGYEGEKRYFAGSLDEIVILSRALSPEGIAYLAGKGGKLSSSDRLAGPPARLPRPMDPRNIKTGLKIPDEGYCDQPYVVVTKQGHWLCTLTTGAGHEGQGGQHFVATISKDKGRTWSPLIDIEPANGPEASYGVPLVVPSGRIYGFYTYNGDKVTTLPGKKKRIRSDTQGWYCFRYSDDGGKTWSKRHRIPMRLTACDRKNDWKGKVQMFWGIDKPNVSDGSVYFAFTKLGYYFLKEGEGWLYRSNNILTEKDPAKIHWQLLPDGEHGIRDKPFGSVQEEHNIVPLGNNQLYCVYRTTMGYPCHTYSRDGGRTWDKPVPMTYTPTGRRIPGNRACPQLWKTKNGKYLFWFHLHGGRNFNDRNPAWLLGGIEKDGKIRWSQPEILLFDDNPKVRMSYPDLVEQDGRYWVTETQKSIARIHEIDATLLEGLWSQGEAKKVTKKGLLLTAGENQIAAGSVALPKLDLAATDGMAIDFWIKLKDVKPGQVIADSRDETGRGLAVQTGEKGTIRIDLNDGKNWARWDSDAGFIKPGKMHHVAIVVDNAPRIISFIVDGVFCDGSGHRQFGWGRYKTKLGDVTGTGKLKLAKCLKVLRVYNRYLRTSEAVANFNAGQEASSVSTASEIAEKPNRPSGSPRYSDVSMRLFRKKKDQSELKAARAFHITRADWSYIRDPAYIKKVKQYGWGFQGSVNAVTHNAEHALRTRDGKPMLDHFKKAGRFWADMDNESYRKWYLQQLQDWAAVGVDSIQRDEPTTIRKSPIPQAAKFHAELHAAFEKKLGRQMPMSCNLACFGSVFGGKGNPVTRLFDFGMAEIGHDKVRPAFFLHASRDTCRRGKAMIFTALRDLGVPKFRLSIAGCYATGMNLIVPWDQYAGVGKPRVFSKPEDLADLYGFVRASAAYLDGYEDVTATGYGLKGTSPALSIKGNDRLTAFIRAKPGDQKAAVVVHLIDWNKPKSCRINLRPDAFFASGKLAVALRTPTRYVTATHEKTEESKDYSPLSKEIGLKTAKEGDSVIVDIPALSPWGMLIVSREE